MDKPFLLERYFAKYEFTAKYLLSSSDCEAVSVKELKEFLVETGNEENLKLIEEYETHKLGYTESQGHPQLRQLVSKSFHSEKISSEDILIGIPEELILIAMNSILKAGDEVIAIFPAYQSLYTIASTIGCKIIKWEMNMESLNFDIDSLLEMITSKTKMVVVNFPHNPSGSILEKEDALKLIKKLEENNTLLFSDEMYRLLDIHERSYSSLSDLYKNCVSLFGMSKSFSCPGIRIGWLSTQNRILMDKFKEYKASEILAMMAIKVHKKILSNNIERIKRNFNIARGFFEKYKNIFPYYTVPRIGSVGVVVLKDDIDINDFSMSLIEKKELMILPLTVFEVSDQKPMFRVGYGRENFPQVLELLKEFVDSEIV